MTHFCAVLAPKGLPGGGRGAQKVTPGTHFLIMFFKSVFGVDFGAILSSFGLLFETQNRSKTKQIFDKIIEACFLFIFALPGGPGP